MDWGTWIALGTLATVILGATFLTDVDEVVFGLLGAIIWGYWSYGATNVVKHVETGAVEYQYTGLAFLGLGMVAISLITMLRGTGAFVRETVEEKSVYEGG